MNNSISCCVVFPCARTYDRKRKISFSSSRRWAPLLLSILFDFRSAMRRWGVPRKIGEIEFFIDSCRWSHEFCTNAKLINEVLLASYDCRPPIGFETLNHQLRNWVVRSARDLSCIWAALELSWISPLNFDLSLRDFRVCRIGFGVERFFLSSRSASSFFPYVRSYRDAESQSSVSV